MRQKFGPRKLSFTLLLTLKTRGISYLVSHISYLVSYIYHKLSSWVFCHFGYGVGEGFGGGLAGGAAAREQATAEIGFAGWCV